MFKRLRRALSIESMATTVQKVIVADMARDVTSPRNALGMQLLAGIETVKRRAAAQKEHDALAREYNRRWPALQKRRDHFNAQSESYRNQHFEVANAEMQREAQELDAILSRVNELKSTFNL